MELVTEDRTSIKHFITNYIMNNWELGGYIYLTPGAISTIPIFKKKSESTLRKLIKELVIEGIIKREESRGRGMYVICHEHTFWQRVWKNHLKLLRLLLKEQGSITFTYPLNEPRRRPYNPVKKTPEYIERSKLTKSLRFDVMNHDNFQCRLCGNTAKEAKLVIDHIIPIAKGGKTIFENLQTLCHPCNAGKQDKLMKPGTE